MSFEPVAWATMSGGTMVAGLTFGFIVFTMVAEAQVSRRHTRALRARGAIEPGRDVYQVMQVVYPLSFVVMVVEGVLYGIAGPKLWICGASLFLTAKLLKYWAIFSLGERWTFRILVPSGNSLVAHGPYRWMTHPNYVAVIGELIGTAVMMTSAVTGPLAIVGFGVLIGKRITVENRALGRL